MQPLSVLRGSVKHIDLFFSYLHNNDIWPEKTK